MCDESHGQSFSDSIVIESYMYWRLDVGDFLIEFFVPQPQLASQRGDKAEERS